MCDSLTIKRFSPCGRSSFHALLAPAKFGLTKLAETTSTFIELIVVSTLTKSACKFFFTLIKLAMFTQPNNLQSIGLHSQGLCLQFCFLAHNNSKC